MKMPSFLRRTCEPHPSHTPWWVRWFTNGGRPIVAIVVLAMCAPGEHHLAVLAGWDSRLAWGMAAVLAAYAGIAASVASNRPTGTPGKTSAVVGAFVSLGAAMAAQPVSHLFVTGWFSAEPRAPWILVAAVSCVPPLVFGHLLHLAATPTARRTTTVEPPALKPSHTPRTAAWATATVPPGARLLPIVPSHTETPPDDDEPDPNSGRLIATSEVAKLKNVSPSTVRTWVDRGRLRPVVRDARNGMLFNVDEVVSLGSAS